MICALLVSRSALGAPVADPITHLSFGYATQLVILDHQGRIERLVAAHDVGRVINPKLLEGQLDHRIGEEMVALVAGSTIHVPRGVHHRATNTGTVPARMIVSYPTGRREMVIVG